MTSAEAFGYLLGLNRGGAKLGLGRMQAFASLLGNPERFYPSIHVAGTNGKGSTCALLESVYRGAGYKTGMFTSPHLTYVGERLRINGVPVGEERLARLVEEHCILADAVASGGLQESPTYFEFMTGMAFSYFKEEAVDVAVVEVGLGGRLDSTNILTPSISVITSIGRDHCEQLGYTIDAIAREKAGIIKPGIPLVIGELPLPAEKVIRLMAKELGSPVYSIRERFGKGPYPKSRFAAPYQRNNTAVAQLVVEVLESSFSVTSEACAQGFASVSWPGRWQEIVLPGGRTLILESAHNEDGAQALSQSLEQLACECKGANLTVLLGSLAADRADALFQVIARYAQRIVLLELDQPRALSFEMLKALVPVEFDGEIVEGELGRLFLEDKDCLGGSVGDVFLATGSIYLIGEVLARLHGCDASRGVQLQDFLVPSSF